MIITFKILFQAVQTLVSQETTVTAIQERHQQLEASITQRLKWAAGANPSLNTVMLQYEESLSAKNTLLQVYTFEFPLSD